MAGAASNVEVLYTDLNGVQILLTPSQYTIVVNPPTPGNLWGIGGTVNYPISGSPIVSGTLLTIQRIVPLTQLISISNQGDFYPAVVERALDILCFEIQQLAARTGQIRGTWATGVVYNFGDIVRDGVNGLNSGNYYTCAIANTSATWTTDLANGDWSLSLPATIPVAPLPLSVANGGTGASTAATALTNLGGIALSANNAFTGANTFTTGSGSIQVLTRGAGDSSAFAASTSFVNSTALTLATGTTAVTQSAGDNSTKVATTAYVNAATVTTQTDVTGSRAVTTIYRNTSGKTMWVNIAVTTSVNQIMSVVTDSSSTPTRNLGNAYGPSNYVSFCFPVLNNNYYQLTGQNTGAMTIGSWVESI